MNRIACLRVAGAIAFALALLSAALHVAGLGHLGAAGAVLALSMAVGCIVCGVHLMRTPSPRGWAVLVGMSSAMIAIHLSAMAMPASHHAMPMDTQPVAAMPMTGLATAMLAVSGVELVFAMVVLWLSTARKRLPAPSFVLSST